MLRNGNAYLFQQGKGNRLLQCNLVFIVAATLLCTIEFARFNGSHTQSLQENALIGRCAHDVLYVSVFLLLPWIYQLIARLIHQYLAIGVLYLIQLSVLFFLCASLVFRQKTGSDLTIELTLYSLKNIKDLAGLLQSGSSDVVSSLMLVLPFLCVFAPRLIPAPAHPIQRPWLLNASKFLSITIIATALSLFYLHTEATKDYRNFIVSTFFPQQGFDYIIEPAPTATQYLPDSNLPAAMYEPQFGSASKLRKNVFVFVLESFRSDLVKQQFPDGTPVIPHLSNLSKEFVYFDNAYTTIPHTSKALIGILCGMFASLDVEIFEANQGFLMDSCLPNVLANNGYQTLFLQSAISGFESRPKMVSNMGFQTFKGFDVDRDGTTQKVGYLGSDDNLLVDQLRDSLKSQKAPYFITVLNSLTHHPYDLPNQKCVAPFDKDIAKQCYLQTASYVDKYIAQMIAVLKQENLYDNSVIVITGDHGEAFVEHGLGGHDDVAFSETMQIPLWIKAPGRKPGISHRLTQHIDVYPTVLSEAGISLTGTTPGKHLFSEVHQHVYSFCRNSNTCMASIDSLGMKYVLNFKEGLAFQYDLNNDPGEQNPLLESKIEALPRADLQRLALQLHSIKSYWAPLSGRQYLASPPVEAIANQWTP